MLVGSRGQGSTLLPFPPPGLIGRSMVSASGSGPIPSEDADMPGWCSDWPPVPPEGYIPMETQQIGVGGDGGEAVSIGKKDPLSFS